MSVNKQILVGRLGQDPESKSFTNGGTVCNFSVATENRWKDRNTGEQKSVTTWHRCVCRNKLAELAMQYLRKGSQVYIEGRTDHRKWDKNGTEMVSTEVVVSELRFLDGRGESTNRPADDNQEANGNQRQDVPDDYMDDDIPFS